MSREKRFKNTFAPWVENKWLTVEMLIGMVKIGFPWEKMPHDAQIAILEAMH